MGSKNNVDFLLRQTLIYMKIFWLNFFFFTKLFFFTFFYTSSVKDFLLKISLKKTEFSFSTWNNHFYFILQMTSIYIFYNFLFKFKTCNIFCSSSGFLKVCFVISFSFSYIYIKFDSAKLLLGNFSFFNKKEKMNKTTNKTYNYNFGRLFEIKFKQMNRENETYRVRVISTRIINK